jgi:hypothetical protein
VPGYFDDASWHAKPLFRCDLAFMLQQVRTAVKRNAVPGGAAKNRAPIDGTGKPIAVA